MTGSAFEQLSLDGGRLALDFVNTVDPREGPEPKVDHLPDYAALVAWSAYAGNPVPTAGLDRESPAARAVWRRAVTLREALYRTFRALAQGEAPAAKDLDLVAREHGRARARRRLTLEGDRLGWAAGDHADLDRPLNDVALSAVEILTREDITRLRWCPPERGGCGWVAYDDTRNRSRRWCSMATCGAEVKARRLAERRREERQRS